MRRGLLAWDAGQVPADVLEGRVARCQAAMAGAGLDALLVYTNFPRPAAVSWLTHFVPYWSQGVLVVPPEGAPEFFVSLSKRVAGWIGETSHMGEIVSTPHLGADVAKRLDGAKRVGVVELSRLPGGIARPLATALPPGALADATALFRAVRQPADAAEIALSRAAAAMARNHLDAALDDGPWAETGALTAAIEGPARCAGAEEVLVELAPDLAADAALRRLDGSFPLGARFAVRVSLAYKGHWVRLGRTAGPGVGDRIAVEEWLAGALPAIADGSGRPASPDGLSLTETVVEACTGTLPLARLSGPLPGAVACAGVTLDGPDGIWRETLPMLLSQSPDQPAELLA